MERIQASERTREKLKRLMDGGGESGAVGGSRAGRPSRVEASGR